MKRIYVGVYGVGLGHASRMVYIADKLDKNDKLLKFSSFGDAVDYIRYQGYSCINVSPVELGWNPELGFAVKDSIMRIPTNFINFINQCGKEASSIGKFRPDLVISDTRLSSLITAKMYNIPTLTILNQIKLLLSNGLRTLSVTRLFEDILAEFLGLFWNRSDDIFVPDLPPPYTISEDNLWNISTISRRLKYIGFLAPKPVIDHDKISNVKNILDLEKPIIFAHISGPNKTKMLVLKDILNTLKDRDDINLIISEGKPNGSINPKRIKNGWYYEWCPVRDEIFALSDLLIVRGGHSTLSQAILYGKPVITIPIENHGEQIGNARKIDKLGLGIMIRQNEIHKKLNDSIDLILLNEKYKDNILKVKELAERLDGIKTIIDKINEY
ncbi:MAG: hypothetical protein KatS3mg003_0351 [Candidatus Nitrosocaldaceae archaeon]|nr:MAG: hypothetical protein KatS3mg003_0351 [Candidatus Nitrosocaldaceae archaeon]